MSYKILIIEDEMPNAQRLQRLILNLKSDAEIVSIEDSIISSVEWLDTYPMPDLIMMDVRLADGLSFEIFKKITITCPVIFTTAYDEYAVQAFKYNSVDYLLKPIQDKELEQAFDKLERQYLSSVKSSLDIVVLQDLISQLQQEKGFRTRFLIPFRDSFTSLSVGEIAYFYSDLGGNKAMLFDGKTMPISQTLETLEKQLDPKQFFRANRQFILHINAIKTIHNSFNGKLLVELNQTTKEDIVISREKAFLFKEWLDY